MKKIIKHIKLLIVFLLLAIVTVILSNYFTLKSRADYGGAQTFAQFCQLSWENVKDLSFTDGAALDASSGNNGDYDDGSGSWSGGLQNSVCFHSYSTVTDNLASQDVLLKAMIEIDENGKVKLYTKKGEKGPFTCKAAKEFAYFAAHTQHVNNDDVNGSYRNDFWYFFNQGIRGAISGDIPTFTTAYERNKLETTEGKNAKANFANGKSEDGKAYVARIFIFYSQDNRATNGGGIQDRVAFFGGEGSATEITIDKYVTKAESLSNPSNSSDLGTTRAGREDTDKEQNPVKLNMSDVKLYYTIKVKNEGNDSVKGKLEDTPDSTFLSNMGGDSIPTNEIELAAGEEKTYTITFDGNSSIASGKYPNKSTFTVYEDGKPTDKSFESSDWVEVSDTEAPTINKYITSITDVSVNDRSGMKEEEKKANPVEVDLRFFRK